MGELAHAKVVDDQQRDRGKFREVVFAGADERGLGEFFEQGVRLTIDDAIALEDGGAADGLREVALPGARRSEEEDVLTLGDEAGGRKVVDKARFIFLLKSKSKVSSERSGSRKRASLCRRSSRRSWRRRSSSATSAETRSMGAIFSVCACRSRVSRTAAIPESRSWRRARSSSMRFITGLLSCDR